MSARKGGDGNLVAQRRDIEMRLHQLQTEREQNKASIAKTVSDDPVATPSPSAIGPIQAGTLNGVEVKLGQKISVLDDMKVLEEADRVLGAMRDRTKQVYLGERGVVKTFLLDFHGKNGVELQFVDGNTKFFYEECLDIGTPASSGSSTTTAKKSSAAPAQQPTTTVAAASDTSSPSGVLTSQEDSAINAGAGAEKGGAFQPADPKWPTRKPGSKGTRWQPTPPREGATSPPRVPTPTKRLQQNIGRTSPPPPASLGEVKNGSSKRSSCSAAPIIDVKTTATTPAAISSNSAVEAATRTDNSRSTPLDLGEMSPSFHTAVSESASSFHTVQSTSVLVERDSAAGVDGNSSGTKGQQDLKTPVSLGNTLRQEHELFLNAGSASFANGKTTTTGSSSNLTSPVEAKGEKMAEPKDKSSVAAPSSASSTKNNPPTTTSTSSTGKSPAYTRTGSTTDSSTWLMTNSERVFSIPKCPVGYTPRHALPAPGSRIPRIPTFVPTSSTGGVKVSRLALSTSASRNKSPMAQRSPVGSSSATAASRGTSPMGGRSPTRAGSSSGGAPISPRRTNISQGFSRTGQAGTSSTQGFRSKTPLAQVDLKRCTLYSKEDWVNESKPKPNTEEQKALVLRENHSSLSSILSLCTRELGWTQRKVERLFGAYNGQEIVSKDDIQDGMVLVATTGDGFIPPSNRSPLPSRTGVSPTRRPLSASRQASNSNLSRQASAERRPISADRRMPSAERRTTSTDRRQAVSPMKRSVSDFSFSNQQSTTAGGARPTSASRTRPASSTGTTTGAATSTTRTAPGSRSPGPVSRTGATPSAGYKSPSNVDVRSRSPMSKRSVATGASTPTATMKPISIRLFVNGEYGDVKSDPIPFRSVTIRPTYKTLSSVFTMFARELGWGSSGRKCEQAFTADGREITEVGQFEAGSSVVAASNEHFVAPKQHSVMYDAYLKAKTGAENGDSSGPVAAPGSASAPAVPKRATVTGRSPMRTVTPGRTAATGSSAASASTKPTVPRLAASSVKPAPGKSTPSKLKLRPQETTRSNASSDSGARPSPSSATPPMPSPAGPTRTLAAPPSASAVVRQDKVDGLNNNGSANNNNSNLSRAEQLMKEIEELERAQKSKVK